jgi:hypothetical protein
MKTRSKFFACSKSIISTTLVIALGLVVVPFNPEKANAVTSFNIEFIDYSPGSDTYNITQKVGENNDVCSNNILLGGFYQIDVTKDANPDIKFVGGSYADGKQENYIRLNIESTNYFSIPSYQYDGIGIECASEDGASHGNYLYITLSGIQKKLFKIGETYTLKLQRNQGNPANGTDVANISAKVKIDGSLYSTSARDAHHLYAGTTANYRLGASGQSFAGDTQIYSSNSDIVSVEGSLSDGKVQLKAKRPGHVVLDNGKSGAEKHELLFVVKPQFELSSVKRSDIDSLVRPEEGSQDKQFHDDIEFLFANNITTGVRGSNGRIRYYGNDSLTRGQFAALMYRFSGSPEFTPTGEDNFSDTSNHQFAKEIAWLKANKISTGDNGAFHPDTSIKRGEIAKFIVKAFATQKEISQSASYGKFVDIDENDEFTQYIKFLGYHEISRGDSTGLANDFARFMPYVQISRGQIAKFLRATAQKLFDIKN